jgi:hypothetical protein
MGARREAGRNQVLGKETGGTWACVPWAAEHRPANGIGSTFVDLGAGLGAFWVFQRHAQ